MEDEPMLFSQREELPWWVYVLLFSVVLIIALAAKFGKPGFYERAMQGGLLSRGLGLLMILGGLFAGFVLIYSPVVKAMDRERVISMHYGFVAVPAAFVLIGAILLIAGNHSGKFLAARHGQQLTALQIAVYALITIICLGLELGFHLLLAHWGYKFGL
jgi:hypothetical protein